MHWAWLQNRGWRLLNSKTLLFQLETSKCDKWVYIRKVLAVLIAFFTFTMLALFLIVKEKVDVGRIPVCEWAAVICAELYVGSFYFDLGDEYYIEQVRVEQQVYKKLRDMDEEEA